MNLSEMIAMVNDNVDDVISNESIVRWLNMGKNRMAVEVRAKFPDIQITSNLDDTFVFDEKYHEVPVLYASAMFKGADGEEGPKATYMHQFELGLRDFSENYDPPMRYRDDEFTQQYVVDAASTGTFTITKRDYDPRWSRIQVYVNDIEIHSFSHHAGTVTIYSDLAEGDAVTITWDNYPVYEQAPLGWSW